MLELDDKDIIKSYQAGDSASVLARRYDCSVWAIINRLKKAGIRVRSPREQNARHLGLVTTTNFSLLELMDGLLLGDASIDPKRFFRIDQRGDRLPWLEWLHDRLGEVGCESKIIPIDGRMRHIEGREVYQQPSNLLYTPSYGEFREQRERWYPNKGKGKQVPDDVILTPLSISQWFCGDGTRHVGGFSFCTHRYPKKQVEVLSENLNSKFGLSSRVGKANRPGQYKLNVHHRDDAFKLMGFMEPYVPECFKYKFQGIRSVRGA